MLVLKLLDCGMAEMLVNCLIITIFITRQTRTRNDLVHFLRSFDSKTQQANTNLSSYVGEFEQSI